MNNTQTIALKPVVLKSPQGYVCFDYDEIVMFKADGHFSLIYTIYNPPPQRICHSLTFIEKNYCRNILFRCHREIIINLRHIEKIETKPREITLKNNLKAKVSVRKFSFLKKLTENLNTEMLSDKPDKKLKNSRTIYRNSSGKNYTGKRSKEDLIKKLFRIFKKS